MKNTEKISIEKKVISIVLRHEGCTQKETAKLLQISPPSVSRAEKEFKEIIVREGVAGLLKYIIECDKKEKQKLDQPDKYLTEEEVTTAELTVNSNVVDEIRDIKALMKEMIEQNNLLQTRHNEMMSEMLDIWRDK